MQLKVLGCSGAEFPGYNLPAFLLDENMAFDAGSITNVLTEEEQLRLQHIFITHAHLDHVNSIPFLADNLIIKNARHRLNIFSIEPVISTLNTSVLNNQLWPDFTAIPSYENPTLLLISLENGKALEIGRYSITPYEVEHSVATTGFLVYENSKNGASFFYTGDTGPLKSWDFLPEKPLDGLIIEVSFPDRLEELALLTGHLTPMLLKLELEKMTAKPKHIFITHIKPQLRGQILMELEKLRLSNMTVLKGSEVLTI